MSSSEHDSETVYHLGPGAFPEVSRKRIEELMDEPAFQLQIFTRAISDLEMGKDVILPDEYTGQSGESELLQDFSILLSMVDDADGLLGVATEGMGIPERFAEPSAVRNLDQILQKKLVQQGWVEDELACGNLIARGYFAISDLTTE